jgi:hypothetical protein
MIRYVLPFTITLTIAAPAFAAEYYIVPAPTRSAKSLRRARRIPRW